VIRLRGELLEMLKMQKSIRDEKWPDCTQVSSRGLKPIRTFGGAWAQACIAADLFIVKDGEAQPTTRLFHDLRRTGVQSLVRAGVSERVSMAISGHKTRSVFDRYTIVAERDLHDVARQPGSYVAESEEKRVGDNWSKRPVASETEERIQLN
jgi:hypothetical protein